jgi:hypothetical protein
MAQTQLVAGSSDNHGLQRGNQPCRRQRHLASGKLNIFARSEDNTASPTRPTTKDCGLSFSMATIRHLNMLTLARPPAQVASLAASSERAQTSWLECLRTYSISPYLSLLSPHASRCPLFFLYPRKQR